MDRVRPLPARSPTTHAHLAALLFAIATGACGGEAGVPATPTSSDLPPAQGCDAQRGCPCAEGAEDLGTPPEGRRRLQLGVGGAVGTRVAVRIAGVGAVVRPADDPGERCFRADLVPGSIYDVQLLAQSADDSRPLSAQWQLVELAPSVLFPSDPGVAGAEPPGRHPAVYTTFATGCGNRSSGCEHDGVTPWLREIAGDQGGHDACGSTRLRTFRADGSDLPNDGRLRDVVISFRMELREQGPVHPPGSRECIIPR